MPLPSNPKKPIPFSDNTRTVKQRSVIQETRIAKLTGGRKQIASGALPFAKGDVKTAKMLVECKTTSKASYSLHRDTLSKISKEAAAEGRTPAMAITFETSEGVKSSEWAVVPLWMLRELEKGFL